MLANPLVFDLRTADAILRSLKDYTTDQRGDIGSLVRFEAVEAVHYAWKRRLLTDKPDTRSLVGAVCSLAAEKLDRVRYRAWQCLEDLWQVTGVATKPMS